MKVVPFPTNIETVTQTEAARRLGVCRRTIYNYIKDGLLNQSKSIAREGGSIAGEARENIEKRVGASVVSSLNAKDKPALETVTPEIDNQ